MPTVPTSHNGVPDLLTLKARTGYKLTDGASRIVVDVGHDGVQMCTGSHGHMFTHTRTSRQVISQRLLGVY